MYNINRYNQNHTMIRIIFNPHCLRVKDPPLSSKILQLYNNSTQMFWLLEKFESLFQWCVIVTWAFSTKSYKVRKLPEYEFGHCFCYPVNSKYSCPRILCKSSSNHFPFNLYRVGLMDPSQVNPTCPSDNYTHLQSNINPTPMSVNLRLKSFIVLIVRWLGSHANVYVTYPHQCSWN